MEVNMPYVESKRAASGNSIGITYIKISQELKPEVLNLIIRLGYPNPSLDKDSAGVVIVAALRYLVEKNVKREELKKFEP
jgi:hypothetical protein